MARLRNRAKLFWLGRRLKQRLTEAKGDQAVILAMGAENPSQVHYRLAVLLRESDAVTAKRHVLDALIDSPRYREAHKLLLEMANQPSS